MSHCSLVKPSVQYLESYCTALRRGWSPDNLRAEAAVEELARAERNPTAFVADLDDMEARGDRITLPDGSTVPRLPGFKRWIWDGEIAGSVGFRWQPGTTELPPHVLGHIGYAVVPWRRGRGYATTALSLLLEELRTLGLPGLGLSHVDITTDPDNAASQIVVTANGGVLVTRFAREPAYGGGEALHFRITL